MTPPLSDILRTQAEEASSNPLFAIQVKAETSAQEAANRVAAHRWELFTGFAGSQTWDIMRENDGKIAQLLMATYSHQDLRDTKHMLEMARWGQNSLASAELIKDAKYCSDTRRALVELAEAYESQAKSNGTKDLEAKRTRRLAEMFQDIHNIKQKYIRRSIKQEQLNKKDAQAVQGSPLRRVSDIPASAGGIQWSDDTESSGDEVERTDEDWVQDLVVEDQLCATHVNSIQEDMYNLFVQIGVFHSYADDRFVESCIGAAYATCR
jgi:hypothetical protein